MRNFVFLGLVFAMLTSCSEYETAGTGFINNSPTEIILREAINNGIKLEGYVLVVDGEELGVLELDGKPITEDWKITNQFKPLSTRYGTFDAVQTTNLNIASSTMVFKITLDGKYVATVAGEF